MGFEWQAHRLEWQRGRPVVVVVVRGAEPALVQELVQVEAGLQQ